VSQQFHAVLKQVAVVGMEVASWHSSGFDGQPPVLTLLSGLAEGTDRLAADGALHEPGWRLHAVAPFDLARYEQDFAAPESLQEFRHLWHAAHARTVLDGPGGEFDAYVPLARVLVDFADVLVVVWNGQRSRGPGGTAGSVDEARRADMPIVRIDPTDPGSCWLEEMSREDQGRSRGLDGLTQRLHSLLVHSDNDHGTGHRARRDLRAIYFAEVIPTARLPRVYDRLVAALQRSGAWSGSAWHSARAARDPGAATRELWSAHWTVMPAPITDAVLDRFAEHHGWADQLATVYAARFRQTFTWIFMLAWVAVLAAFMGATGVDRYLHGVPVVGLVEVGVLTAISRLVLRGRKHRFHERWLDYRALAERLRHLAIVWPMIRSTTLIRVPAENSPQDPRESWVVWVLRCVARDAGLAEVTCSPAYADACRTLLRNAELAPQRAFHTRTMTRSARVQRTLARSAEVAFLVAAALAFAHLVTSMLHVTFGSESTDHIVELMLAGISVTLPAVAASIHGFLGTGDFSGTSLRSAGIEPRLAQLETRLRRLDPVDTTEVGKVAIEATALMETELSTWRTVAQTRELETP
jgi:hypothetical protein